MKKPIIAALLLVALGMLAQGLRDPGFVASLSKGSFATAFDSFDRMDADPMSTTMSSGWTWTSGPGDMDDAKILANNLFGGTAGVNGAVIATPTFSGNHRMEVAISAGPTVFGPMARMQPGTASGYLVSAVDGVTLRMQIVTNSGGGFTYGTLGADITVASIGIGDVLGIQAVGTNIAALINGTNVGSRADASWSGGQPGIYYFGTSGGASQMSATDL